MISTRLTPRAWTVAGTLALVLAAVLVASAIATGRLDLLALTGMGILLAAVAAATVANWRTGTMLFLLWLLLEDLPRKYLGNNMLVYFGKDVLVALVYASFLLAVRSGRERLPRYSFAAPVALFVALGLLQVLNPQSPSLLYGLLGLKVYFYYIPLVFVGYSLLRTEGELQGFLLGFAGIALVIALLGIVQGIVGLDFLNPQVLAPELEALGREVRRSPITGALVPRATSIFVSEARQGSFMLLAFVLTVGGAASLVVRRARGASMLLLSSAVTFVALMLHGSRGGFLFGIASLGVLTGAVLWSGGADTGHRRRLAGWIAGASAAVLAIGGAIVALFPASVMARWAFYSETLNPASSASELGWRVWEHPWLNFRIALESGHALLGQGIGTASLGVPYVQQLLGTSARPPWVESGYGTLLLELGVLGPVLWVAWSAVLLHSCLRVLRQLRGTAAYSVGAAITWFSFLLMFPLTYGALNAYQNYLYNAFFWLLVGVLHRLPALAGSRLASDGLLRDQGAVVREDSRREPGEPRRVTPLRRNDSS